MSNINYNEKGQRSKIEFGNNTQTEYFYEAKTFRLMQLLTTRNSNTQNPLQDLRYTYDPVGNIVEIYDASKETSYYKNSAIEPRHLFTYDALYRLLSGTGRELLGLAQATSGGYAANSAGAADAKALHTYTQQFAYDELGNIKSIQHQTKTSTLNWTRNYVYDGATNRLLKHDEYQTLPDYTYDEHGNITKMPHLQSMHYDYKDQLNSVMLDASENMAYYVYDANGQRVRKVVVKGNVREERIYVGGYEVFRKYENSVLDLERSSVHIMDDKNRVAIVEKLKINEGKAVTVSENCRYQYSNHLGSASLELDATGQIISYEEFHPFGTTSYRSGTNDTEVSLKRYKYIGKERDEETGLYYYGFRYYAPWIARFINVDPLQHEYPHYTPFQYAGNKPITYIDLDGLEEKKVDETNVAEGNLKIILGDEGFSEGTIDEHDNTEKLRSLTNSLIKRLNTFYGNNVEFPQVVYEEKLPSYGQYDNDVIKIGDALLNGNFTEDEMISVIYHEYIHYKNDKKNLFPLCRNEDGGIVQWDTDESYIVIPTFEEVEKGLAEIIPLITNDSMTLDQIELITEQQRALLSLPSEQTFTYAPSNLALDEISAYSEQIAGETKGLYVLSAEYRVNLEKSIISLEAIYQRRLDYEKRFGLNPDGSKK